MTIKVSKNRKECKIRKSEAKRKVRESGSIKIRKRENEWKIGKSDMRSKVKRGQKKREI